MIQVTDFLCPSRNEAPRLGSRPLSLSSAPITRAEMETQKMYVKIESNSWAFWERTQKEDGTDARDPLTRHQDLVDGEGRATQGKNRVAPHRRLERPRGIRGRQN
jgi:hypothetical protein